MPDLPAPQCVGPSDAADRYELQERRSSGGEGEIWSATEQHGDFSFRYAVKIIHAEHMADADQWLERLRLQVALLTQVEHPALVKVREVFVGAPPHPPGTGDVGPAGPPRLYLVMKWIEGQSLQQALESGRIAGRDVLGPLEKVAEAVDYLHSGRDTRGTPVLHRDIKPANILLADDGRVYLVDFGLVRFSAGATRSAVSGTVPFMAPESLHRGEYGPATDRYAVGATLYYALTGETPVPGDVDGMTRRLTGVLGATDSRMVRGVLTMLAVSPSHRPQSAAGWVRALRAPVADTTMGGAPAGPPPTTTGAPPRPARPAGGGFGAVPPTTSRPAPPPPPYGPMLPGGAAKPKRTGLRALAIVAGVLVLVLGSCVGLGAAILHQDGSNQDGSNQGTSNHGNSNQGASGTPTPTVSIDRGDPPPSVTRLQPVLVTKGEIAKASGLTTDFLDASSADVREGLLLGGLDSFEPCSNVAAAGIGSQTSNGYSSSPLADHSFYASSSVAGFFGDAAADFFDAAVEQFGKCGWQPVQMSRLGQQSMAYTKNPGDDIYAPTVVVLVRSGQVVFELAERSDAGDEQAAAIQLATAMAKHLPKATK